jgi:hypothetical protein
MHPERTTPQSPSAYEKKAYAGDRGTSTGRTTSRLCLHGCATLISHRIAMIARTEAPKILAKRQEEI